MICVGMFSMCSDAAVWWSWHGGLGGSSSFPTHVFLPTLGETANHKVCMFILVIPSKGLLWKCASISGQLGPMTFRSLRRQLNADWSFPVMRMRGMLGGCKQHYQGTKWSVFFMVLSVMLLSHLRALIPCFLEPFCTKNRVSAWTWNSLQQSATAAFPGLLKKCLHENSRNPQTRRCVMRLPAFLHASAAKNHVFRQHLPAFPCQR